MVRIVKEYMEDMEGEMVEVLVEQLLEVEQLKDHQWNCEEYLECVL